MRRGDVHLAQFDPIMGHELGGTRPAVVVQNDVGNAVSPTTIVVPVTNNPRIARFPFAVPLSDGALRPGSVVNCAHVRTMDRGRLSPQPIARLDIATMALIDDALRSSLGLRFDR